MKEIRITPPLQMEDRDNGISLFCDGIEQDIAFLEFREDSGREYSDLTNEQVKAHATYIVKAVNNFDNMKMFLKRSLQILETDYPKENTTFVEQLKEAIAKAEAQS